ncbi:MAG: hypothetical protein NTX61_16180 [Bacteroidetes bacterium]|nr:hypothetical protein [Bacteroidota bacterium]
MNKRDKVFITKLVENLESYKNSINTDLEQTEKNWSRIDATLSYMITDCEKLLKDARKARENTIKLIERRRLKKHGMSSNANKK